MRSQVFLARFWCIHEYPTFAENHLILRWSLQRRCSMFRVGLSNIFELEALSTEQDQKSNNSGNSTPVVFKQKTLWGASMAITWRNFKSGIEHSIAFQPPDTKHLKHQGQALSRRSVGSFEGAATAQHSDSASILHGTSKPDQGYPQSPAGKRHKPQAPLTLSALLKVQGAEFTPANSYALSEAR